MKQVIIYIWWFILLPFVISAQEGSQNYVVTPLNPGDSLKTEEADTMAVPFSNSRTFSPGFKEKYKGDEFDYTESKEKSAFARFLESLFNRESSHVSGPMGQFLIWLIRAIILIAALYGVYILVTVLMGKEGNWLFGKKSDLRSLTYGHDDADIATSDYMSLIENAVSKSDYRQAVRYQYLYLLQRLAGHGIITLHREKTNTDYRYEIRDKNLADAFSYVSYIYDHAWYGAFEMTDAEYRLASAAFNDTHTLT